MRDSAQAKDIVQDLFIGLWNNRNELKIKDLKGYLRLSARNNALRFIASGKGTEKVYEGLDELNDSSEHGHADHSILAKELWAAYHHVVGKMPDQRRRIYQMRSEEDLSVETIAERLKITSKTVYNQLSLSAADIQKILKVAVAFLCTWLV